MTGIRLLLCVGVLAFILWRAQRLPLAGRRRLIVVALRLLAMGALLGSLWGLSWRSTHEVPQQVLYLVDRSESMDASQNDWIARRIASLEAVRPQPVSRAVVAFADTAAVAVPFGHEALVPSAVHAALDGVTIQRDATNLEDALLRVVTVLPAGQGGRVVLFSDGRETVGNTNAVLAQLRRLGLQVFPEPVPRFGAGTTVWEALAVPPVVQQGSPAGLQLILSNGSSATKTALIAVSLSGIVIKRLRAAVRPGWQVLTVPVPAVQRGSLSLGVDLDIPEDGLREHRVAYTEVEGPPHVLVVDDQPTALPLLASALRRRDITVSLARPGDLPTHAQPLLDYDAVLLFRIPKSALSTDQVEALRVYLEQYGGGLIMVGLDGDLAHEVSTQAPLDALLPVRFEAKGLQESTRRVCMIMLIDRSASMIGPRIAATKRAAVELIRQLSAEDLVGVLAFDTKPYIIVEVQPAGQVGERLIEKLVKLRSSGGTDVYPALTSAKDRLDQTGATLKHIILLSDGNTPFPREKYRALVQEFSADHVTISTIGVGVAFINEEYLQWLAGSTGGTFYQLRGLEDLPQLVAQDTEEALGKLPFAEGYFRPQRSPASDWFEDIVEWPVLKGYLTTTVKSGTRVDLTVRGSEEADPLLARWSVGQGRVAVFTSDADTRWSPDWIRWPGFDAWWAHVVRWAMRPRLSEELFVRVDASRGSPQLILDGALQDPRAQLAQADGGSVIPLSLVQTGAWRWQAPLEGVPSGWYELNVASSASAFTPYHGEAPPAPYHVGTGPVKAGPVPTRWNGAGRNGGVIPEGSSSKPRLLSRGTGFTKRWVEVGTPPASNELTGQPPRESLLRQLAEATGGFYGAPDAAFLPPTTTGTTREPLLIWMLPLVIILLLIEIAIRGSTML